MPKSTVREDDPYPLPMETVFEGTLINCEAVNVAFTKRDGSASNFDKWEWTLLVTAPDEYSNVEVKGSTEPKITDASEAAFLPLARPLVEAFLGRSLAVGEDVDTDDLIGLPCQFTVRHLDPRPRKNGDGHWFNVDIDEVFPPASAQGLAAPSLATQFVTAGDTPPF